MPPKSKNSPAGTLKPLRLREVSGLTPAAQAAARRPRLVPPSVTGIANHARHHVSLHMPA